MKAAAALLALALALARAATAAEPYVETVSEREAVDGISQAVRSGNCALAVDRLNRGLAARHGGVYLVAGTLYEEGLCLKPNWERAQQMYQRAAATGHPGAPLKMVAGHAMPGREAAVALWWAQQSQRLPLPGACTVPASVHDDPEAYAAALKAWPAGRLAACTYVAAVLATVVGDAAYPRLALDLAMEGSVAMAFTPGDGRFEWRTLELNLKQMRGLSTSDDQLLRNSRTVQDSLRRYLEDAGQRALRRYARPDGIDPAWRLETTFNFAIY